MGVQERERVRGFAGHRRAGADPQTLRTLTPRTPRFQTDKPEGSRVEAAGGGVGRGEGRGSAPTGRPNRRGAPPGGPP